MAAQLCLVHQLDLLHVGPGTRLGDGQRSDHVAAQRGLDELGDQPLVACGDHVRYRDTDGEQRGEHPTGGACFVQFLADDRDVCRVTALTADRLREADSQQTCGGGCAAEIPG